MLATWPKLGRDAERTMNSIVPFAIAGTINADHAMKGPQGRWMTQSLRRLRTSP